MYSRRSTRQTLLVVLTTALLLTSCSAGAPPAPTQDINAMSTAIVETTIAHLSIQFTETAFAIPTNTAPATETQTSIPTLALPTFAETTTVVTLPTLDPNLLTPATLSFVSTPVAGSTSALVLPTVQGLATATLEDLCHKLAFESDVTISDGQILAPGINFQKIWAVRNTGSCIWDEGYTLVYIGGSEPNLDPYNFEFKNSNDFVPSGQGINLAINLTTPCTPGKYEGHWRMRDDKNYYFGTILSVYVTVVDKCK